MYRFVLRRTLCLLLSLGGVASMAAQRTSALNQPIELGKVSWFRDYDQALVQSKTEQKPILILFQEVPGCQTCQKYGSDVLSHPLMTEVIENEFIPLAIFNNKRGKDLQILKKYNEPTWNNPVVRIVDAQGADLVKRLSSNYSSGALYRQMEQALKKQGIPIPTYMEVLQQELALRGSRIREAHFKMYCFWTGEKELGSVEGVLHTQAGFMNGEVVKVTYNPDETNERELFSLAAVHDMKAVKDNGNFSWSKKDEDYFLQKSRFKYLPLSTVQKTKINSALGNRQDPLPYLSPQQLQWFKKGKSLKAELAMEPDFQKAWQKMKQYN